MIIKKKIKRQAFLRQRQRKALTLKMIFWTIGIVVLLIILTVVSRLDYFRIKTIEVVGNQAVPTESVQLEANKILSGSHFYLWPRNNIIWYSLSGIDNKVLNTFQRFTFVESKRAGWKKINLNVVERKPYAVWCKERPTSMSEVNPVGCFLLDKEGFVFDKAPDFSGHLFVYFYGRLDSVNPIGLILK
jgi:cell division septal protein FtsQ